MVFRWIRQPALQAPPPLVSTAEGTQGGPAAVLRTSAAVWQELWARQGNMHPAEAGVREAVRALPCRPSLPSAHWPIPRLQQQWRPSHCAKHLGPTIGPARNSGCGQALSFLLLRPCYGKWNSLGGGPLHFQLLRWSSYQSRVETQTALCNCGPSPSCR